MKPLVSVVIPTYNRARTIIRAINSVLCQTYDNVEVIVVDDCSQDDTENVIASEYGNNRRVMFHKLDHNSGACKARNIGVQLSHGEFVAFLDSDDEFLPDKLSKQIECIVKYNASLCASDYTIVYKDGSQSIIETKPGRKDQVLKDLLYCNYITTGTLIGYRSCFLEEPFDEILPRYQDWDLVLRLCQRFSIHLLRERTLVQYSQDVSITKSTNHEKTLRALKVVYNKNKKLYDKNKRAYCQIHWLMGIHEIFVAKHISYNDLWIGVTANGFNFHRFLIYLYVKLGLTKMITKYF